MILAARRHQSLPFRRPARRLCPARQRHAPARGRCRTAGSRRAYAHALPFLDFDNARFPIQGGLLQQRGGTVRHDAVAWGLCPRRRSARRRYHPELRGHRYPSRRRARHRGSRRRAASSPRQRSRSRRRGQFLESRGQWPILRLPIESHVLQAFVSEGVKPLIDTVVTFGAGHFLTSASPTRAGSSSGGISTATISYAQRGNLPVIEDRDGMRHGPVAGARAVCGCCGTGAASWTCRLDGSPIIDAHPGRGALSECRLVLWRLQGHPGFRAVALPI